MPAVGQSLLKSSMLARAPNRPPTERRRFPCHGAALHRCPSGAAVTPLNPGNRNESPRSARAKTALPARMIASFSISLDKGTLSANHLLLKILRQPLARLPCCPQRKAVHSSSPKHVRSRNPFSTTILHRIPKNHQNSTPHMILLPLGTTASSRIPCRQILPKSSTFLTAVFCQLHGHSSFSRCTTPFGQPRHRHRPHYACDTVAPEPATLVRHSNRCCDRQIYPRLPPGNGIGSLNAVPRKTHPLGHRRTHQHQ